MARPIVLSTSGSALQPLVYRDIGTSPADSDTNVGIVELTDGLSHEEKVERLSVMEHEIAMSTMRFHEQIGALLEEASSLRENLARLEIAMQV